MMNLRKSTCTSALSKSMPKLNIIDECNESTKNVAISTENNYGKCPERRESSIYVRKWFFSSMSSLNRPSSNGHAKSAPVTPQYVENEKRIFESSFNIPSNVNLNYYRDINKTDRHGTKQLSTGIQAMTHAHSVARGPTDPDGSAGAPMITKMSESSELVQNQGLHKTRQKKFNRHFKQVASEETVLDYYSCALVGDILLQGRLYVTKNYFAFYSNVFGYVTKLLIPMVDVMDVSKEKTAKIIPNAVGISTEDEKHVFGSLLSRDSTYKFMVEVWHAAKCPDPAIEIAAPKVIKNDIEDSASGDLLCEDDSTASLSGNEDVSAPDTPLQTISPTENFKNLISNHTKRSILRIPISTKTTKEYWSAISTTTILIITTALLVLLYLSAGFLLYRISIIQNQFNDYPLTSTGDIYHDILKWQSELHSRSASEVHEFLNANLNQIARVRLSLEALSMLILTGNNKENDVGKNSNPGDANSETPKENTKKDDIS